MNVTTCVWDKCKDDFLKSPLVAWVLVFIPFLVVYWLTAQHGVSWQDSGGFQIRAIRGDLFDRSLALSHPGYVFLASSFARLPFDDPITLINRFSALGMAIALANLSGMLTFLTRQPYLGILAAIILGVSHAVWWLSTIAEVYTWSVAILTLELWILALILKSPTPERAYLWPCLAFLNGFGLTIHNVALLTLPVYALVCLYVTVKLRLPTYWLIFGVLAYLAGAGLYLIEIVERIVTSGDFVGVVTDALVGSYGEAVFNLQLKPPSTFNYFLGVLSFANILPIFAAFGLLRGVRYLGKSLFLAILSIALLEFVFVIRYPVPDQFTFFLPTLMLLGILGGLGMWIYISVKPHNFNLVMFLGALSAASSIVIFLSGPFLVDITGWKIQRARELPFRDEIRYWLVPWKHDENSAHMFAQAAFDEMEVGGIILVNNDETAQFPLVAYKEVYEDSRPNLFHKHIASRFDLALPTYSEDPMSFCATAGGRPLYAVSPVPGYFDTLLLSRSVLVRVGVLYKVELGSDVCPQE